MNLLKLNDVQLADLRLAVTQEAGRRAKAATNGLDSAAIIQDNELAKRALQIAVAGRHSILFVGPSKCGKTMLRAAALELGLEDTFEVRCCPCGNHSDPRSVCHCTAKQVERQVAKYPITDIAIEVHRSAERQRHVPGTSLAQMRDHIANSAQFTDLALDQDSSVLLKACSTELGLDPATRERCVQVARTIANLDQADRIGAAHISEAISYRMLGWRR
jgi:predicted ATPase with chaperone activity